MTRLFILLLLPVLAFSQDSTQIVIPGRSNDPGQIRKPYIILISADGFRYDLANKYHATHLIGLREKGVEASAMSPSYPSLTFPNHYALVTGLYPSHHGIVDNTFYSPQKGKTYQIRDKSVVLDGSWYGGIPLWVLAEQQHMISASLFWVGSEAAIKGVRPTYYCPFNNNIPLDQRIHIVKDWLTLPAEKRPHFITFYLSEVDHAEHYYGVDSKEARDAVRLVDDCIGKLAATVDSLHLPVNFIFVADHGMAAADTLHTIGLPAEVDTTKFLVRNEEALLHLYARDKSDILPAYRALKANAKDYDVYLPDQTPAHWHYTRADDRFDRIGDILLVTKYPKVFNLTHRKNLIGMHGFDNALADMQASFYAWGPAFKQHWKTGSFQNVDVYPLIARILGLNITEEIDGNLDALQNILK